mmetsp:Transcript_73556/g.227171  ORF Transcript_73556/g.227171 Transcript_73556/m.227171 type:complete len:283 (-) Transcript_73556:321-1169(-)
MPALAAGSPPLLRSSGRRGDAADRGCQGLRGAHHVRQRGFGRGGLGGARRRRRGLRRPRARGHELVAEHGTQLPSHLELVVQPLDVLLLVPEPPLQRLVLLARPQRPRLGLPRRLGRRGELLPQGLVRRPGAPWADAALAGLLGRHRARLAADAAPGLFLLRLRELHLRSLLHRGLPPRRLLGGPLPGRGGLRRLQRLSPRRLGHNGGPHLAVGVRLHEAESARRALVPAADARNLALVLPRRDRGLPESEKQAKHAPVRPQGRTPPEGLLHRVVHLLGHGA